MASVTRPAGQAQAQPARPHGRLVTLEGIDGSGKSRLASELGRRLEAAGVHAVVTREPTDSWLGQAVKRAIRESTDPFVEAFLFMADHADHVRQVEQWLSQGRVVVSDRYGDSCIAYQAAALEPLLKPRGVHAADWLQAVQGPVHRPPDVCLLLDLPTKVALERIQDRSQRIKFEEQGFLDRVRRNYLDLALRQPYYEVVDASQPPARLADGAWAVLARRGVVPG